MQAELNESYFTNSEIDEVEDNRIITLMQKQHHSFDGHTRIRCTSLLSLSLWFYPHYSSPTFVGHSTA